jgi:DNA polymerase-3 subunit epsilon
VTFVALDFETADPMRDSACALALVRVEHGRIVARESRLLRPPRREFWFTHIHGITWRMVEGMEAFEAAWPGMEPMLAGADFLAAHNAVFDRSVMGACCERAGLAAPPAPYLCTVKLARRVWGIHPTRLPDVCGRLDIPLRHHDASSDAEACALIVLRAMEEGGREAVEALLSAPTGATASPPRARASRRR